MNITITCNATEYGTYLDKKYQALEFSITKNAFIISFCDCFGTEITQAEISIEDAKQLAKLLLTI